MASLNITLSQSLKDYVEEQVKRSGYNTPSEYVRELLQQDRIRHAEQRLEALLIEGIASGDSIEITPQYWENKRRLLVERHTGRHRAGDKVWIHGPAQG